MALHSLDIVIPIHNEFPNLGKMIAAMETGVAPAFSRTRLIFVDDGSSDGTRGFFSSLKVNPSLDITYLRFSKNFRKDMAVKCGIDHSAADFCATIDGDLQQPPEAILEAYAEALKGYDVVHIMKSEYKTSFMRRVGSRLFAQLISTLAGFKIHLSDFKLLNRKVVSELSVRNEKSLFFAGVVDSLGFESKCIEYHVAERAGGRSNFSLVKLIVLAIKSIVSISVKPLRFASIIGLIMSLASLFFTIWIVGEKLVLGQEILGFTTLAGGVFMLGGLQLLFLGVIGEYLGQIYVEVKGRKQYIVQEEIRLEKDNR